MKRNPYMDLSVGDRVWVVLAYEGGSGWATILDLDTSNPYMRTKVGYSTSTILVRFDDGQSAKNLGEADARLISAREIIRHETPEDIEARQESAARRELMRNGNTLALVKLVLDAQKDDNDRARLHRHLRLLARDFGVSEEEIEACLASTEPVLLYSPGEGLVETATPAQGMRNPNPTDLCVVCEHERQYHRRGICTQCLGGYATHIFEFDYAGHKAKQAGAEIEIEAEAIEAEKKQAEEDDEIREFEASESYEKGGL